MCIFALTVRNNLRFSCAFVLYIVVVMQLHISYLVSRFLSEKFLKKILSQHFVSNKVYYFTIFSVASSLFSLSLTFSFSSSQSQQWHSLRVVIFLYRLKMNHNSLNKLPLQMNNKVNEELYSTHSIFPLYSNCNLQ